MKKNRYYYGLVLLFLIVLVGCFIFRENLSVSLKDNVRSITDVLNITKADLQKPKYAHRSMELHEGLEVSLWAAEPDLFNPTNINVDHLGRTWLIEALNYRNDFNPNNPYRNEGDRILILEDTNDDGSSDSRKVFYQGEDINAALGIWVMDNKVIVSASPNILLLTDEDRDGKADKKEKLFTNLGGENHDHGAHAFIFGPDGRLYFVLGNECKSIFDSNGVLIQEKNGRDLSKDKAHLNQGMALRCELDGTGVELVAHNLRNSFELTTDSYGTIWLSDNDDDGNKATRLNYIMEYGNFGYSDEVTGAGWRSRRVSMHDEIPKRHWHQNDPGSIPSLLYTGSGSPAGIAFYEGDQLPEIFQNQMIHCEPGHGVVRAYPLQKDGAGYKAETIDIMKSKDQWFRPSDVCVAPDGSLMVADWYDSGVGGHRMGDTERGRLFRITAKGKDYETPTYDLTSPEGAAKALVNPNMSLRYMAWTKLEAWDNEAEEALLQLWNDEKQTTRARALWLLGRLSINGKKHLTSALTDNNPDIRITALRAVRQLYPDMVLNVCEKLAMDAAPEVRREVGIALRYNNDPIAAAKIWTKLANQYNGEDRWYLEALGLAADLNADVFFEHWEAQVGTQLEQPAAIDIIWRMRTEKALPYLVEKIKDEKVSNESLKKYFRAFHFIRAESKNTFLAELLDLNHPLSKEIATYTLEQMDSEFVKQNPAVKAKINIILPKIKGTHEWLIAIRSLQLESEVEDLLEVFEETDDPDFALETANVIINIEEAKRIHEAIDSARGENLYNWITRLGWVERHEMIEILTQEFANPDHDINTKRSLLEALGNTWLGQLELDTLLTAGKIEERFHTLIAIKLSNSWDKRLKTIGQDILAKHASDQKLAPLAQLTKMNGNAEHGALVFEDYCSSCHQVNGEGINYGPDLSEIGSKLSVKGLYTTILYPSAGINFGYEGYVLRLKDGNVFQGIIDSQTETELNLRMMGGASQVISYKNIESKELMENSLMMEGLWQAMGEEKLVNVVSYLKTLTTTKSLESLTLKE